MELEVISEQPQRRTNAAPLLFVHGACAGAWVWKHHFLPYFADHGYAAYALSLRGHGGSDGKETLAFAGISDFARDVERVAAQLDAPPVLIGHSMGGMVVQKVLHRRRLTVPGAVLMASAPPHGIAGCFVHMLTRNPRLLFDMTMMQTFGPQSLQFIDLDIIRRALFSDDTPEEAVYRYAPQFGAESVRAVFDLWGFDTVPSRQTIDTPVLVLGAENDAFISEGSLRETAWTYKTQPERFPNMAHAMMLDHNWETVAARIRRWLGEAVPRRPRIATGTAAA